MIITIQLINIFRSHDIISKFFIFNYNNTVIKFNLYFMAVVFKKTKIMKYSIFLFSSLSLWTTRILFCTSNIDLKKIIKFYKWSFVVMENIVQNTYFSIIRKNLNKKILNLLQNYEILYFVNFQVSVSGWNKFLFITSNINLKKINKFYKWSFVVVMKKIVQYMYFSIIRKNLIKKIFNLVQKLRNTLLPNAK
jgi:hypothetical protein